jgi:hypothetical protein
MEPIDEFQPTYPCYFLLQKDSIIFNERGDAVGFSEVLRFVGLDAGNAQWSLPLFTDEDLSRRFVASSPDMKDVACIFAKDGAELCKYLEMAKRGFATVVFDPDKPTGWKRRIWPIDYAITQIKTRQGLR